MHRWSGLICTAFLLVICITGLPLIFEDEIDHWRDAALPCATVAADGPRTELKAILSSARERYPGPVAPSWRSFSSAPRVEHGLKFDARTGALLRNDETVSQVGASSDRMDSSGRI